MTTETPIELRKIAYRQSAKDGLVITFAVHPDDMPPALAAAPIGSRFAAALVEIGDDEKPIERERQHPLVQKAGILCNDPMFHKFIHHQYPLDWNEWVGTDEERAAACIRLNCGVSSRREFATDADGAAKFDAIIAKFEMWKRGE